MFADNQVMVLFKKREFFSSHLNNPEISSISIELPKIISADKENKHRTIHPVTKNVMVLRKNV